MNQRSPFSGNRFEMEGEHTYFLQPDSFGRLEREVPLPVYLVGPRGTGKTTLLKALDTAERRSNNSLRKQLGDDPFAAKAGPFIGVYFRAPEIQLGLIEAWGEGEVESELCNVLALYLDLQWLQHLTRSIAELLAEGVLVATTLEERKVVKDIVSEFPSTLADGRRSPQTVAELRTTLKQVAAELDSAARRRSNWRDVISRCDAVQQAGGFGRVVATALARLCRRAGVEEEQWHFRICIDEADALTDVQLRALNSSVRLSGWPVFPVAAFGGVARDFTSTALTNLSIQPVDCDIIDLSAFLTLRRFRELAEGVAGVRVSRVLDEETSVDLKSILGTISVNGLLNRMLVESVSPQAKALLASARTLKVEPFFVDAEGEEPELSEDGAPAFDNATDLPLYQAYLVERLKLQLPKPEEPAWYKRRQESAELRKRMVASYLSICHELKTHVRYASARMVLQLSDLCIRDFLRFMDALHSASGLNVKDFVTREMSWKDQHAALLDASKSKCQSIRGLDLRAPRETESVVSGLAELTRLLQVQSVDGAHLRTSERGIFILPVSRWRDNDRAAQTVRDACNTGLLTFLSEDETQISFRVHCALAPAFQFSYRGAYYPVQLLWSEIETMSTTRRPEELRRIAESVAIRIARAENLSLFEPE